MKPLLILLILVTPAYSNPCTDYYGDIVKIVEGMGFTVTATVGKRHNVGSKHYLGKAVDVRTRDKTNFHIDTLIEVLNNQGYGVIDERVRPRGQKVWSGPHLHVYSHFCKPKYLMRK